MLYSVIFLVITTSVCICSTEPWETFVDRLDLFIRDSYLTIRCNENEIEIIRFLTTFDELKSNLKCTNKDDLFEHGIDKIQIIDFDKVLMSCHKDKNVHLEGHFNQLKVSLNKKENDVDWPYVHTPYTKEIGKTDPNKFKFLEKKEITITLTEIKSSDLPSTKKTLYIHFDFVNRPMVCRIRIDGLQKKTNDGSCIANIIDAVYEPLCYYKVNGDNTPSHEELNEIVNKTYLYAKNSARNYTYISNIHTFVDDSHNHDGDVNEKNSSKSEKEKKLSPLMIIIIIIFIVICLILLIIGIIFYHKKYSKENDQLEKQKSDSSYESQISIVSNKSDSIKSQKNLPPVPVKQFHNNKQKFARQAATNWFKLDEDI